MDKIKRAIDRNKFAKFLTGKGESKFHNRDLRDPTGNFIAYYYPTCHILNVITTSPLQKK